MPALRATGAAAETSAAKSGPMISSAPSCTALSAAARAPSGEPRVSLGTSVTLGLSKSKSASSAACFSAFATDGVLPEPVIGRSSATFTAPPPPAIGGSTGPVPPPPEVPQAASNAARHSPASASVTARRAPPIL